MCTPITNTNDKSASVCRSFENQAVFLAFFHAAQRFRCTAAIRARVSALMTPFDRFSSSPGWESVLTGEQCANLLEPGNLGIDR